MAVGSRLHLFNPENDLALGLDCRHYTPPPRAAALHRAGGLLPVWWARHGDTILLTRQSDHDEADARWMKNQWGLTAIISHRNVPTDAEPTPWGWSHDAVRQFLEAGVSPLRLPSQQIIERFRALSHRRSSIAILKSLDYKATPLPVECDDADRAMDIEMSRRGCFFKSPWSCSGRGVFCGGSMSATTLRCQLEGIIRRQGSVMVEQGLPKILDIAALFHSDGRGKMTYHGLSVFLTGANGSYSGNIIASQTSLLDIIDSYGLLDEYQMTCSRLIDVLSDLAGDYTGYLGVDMMIYTGPHGNPALHPCIELNLRTTMGVTAMAINDIIRPSLPMVAGWHRVSPGAGPPAPSTLLLPYHQENSFCLTLSPLKTPVSLIRGN